MNDRERAYNSVKEIKEAIRQMYFVSIILMIGALALFCVVSYFAAYDYLRYSAKPTSNNEQNHINNKNGSQLH